MKNAALILVNLQKDFMTEGALPVPNAHEVIPIANYLMPQFNFVVAVKDWHPPKHISFIEQHPGKKIGDEVPNHTIPQFLWPSHCVQHSEGAALADDLDQSRIHHVIHKGVHEHVDSYSAFLDNHGRLGTGLHTLLKFQRIQYIYVLGLTTDFSVKYTALDGLKLGYDVHVVHEGCRGISENPNLVFEHLSASNAKVIGLDEIRHRPNQQSFAFDLD
ncbi:MAG: rutB [Gammaproteobacteria bacterium]|jgi:nicotinamidase/pyrazinamidase|nr:rutB [Gammaproteobacteria bacterium]